MLIGLCGMPRSGKSEVRKILVKKHGFHVLDTKVILRDMAARLTGLSAEDFVSQEDKDKLYCGMPRRKIMGEIGNSIEAMWGDSFLLNRSLEELQRYANPYKKIVVDSLRKEQPIGFPGLVYEVLSCTGIDTGNDFDRYNKSRTNGIICNYGSLYELERTVERVFQL